MLQAAVCDGGEFDASAFGEDILRSTEVNVGRCEVIDALMIADVIVVLDEGPNLALKVSWQIVVFEQNAVLQGLVPALDLALGLWVIRRSPHMLHALVLEPVSQIAGNIGPAIVAE